MSEEKIRKKVEEFLLLSQNRSTLKPSQTIMLSSEGVKEHVINIGTSIICTKLNVGYPGGSFVQSIVGNKLKESFQLADNINKEFIGFYCELLDNY